MPREHCPRCLGPAARPARDTLDRWPYERNLAAQYGRRCVRCGQTWLRGGGLRQPPGDTQPRLIEPQQPL